MSGATAMLFALGAMLGGGPDGRPGWSPDPRVPQTPDSAAAARERAEAKRPSAAPEFLRGGARAAEGRVG